MSKALVEEALQDARVVHLAIPENRALFPDDFYERMYLKLKEEDLLEEMLHEHKETSLQDFLDFVNNSIITIFANPAKNVYYGMAWLAEPAETATLRRAWGGFVFLRDFWDPRITLPLGMQCLAEWFRSGLVDLVVGITPAPNRAAQRYSIRLGFKYTAQLPNFTTYRGQTVDAMICQMSRSEFDQMIQERAQRAERMGEDG